MCEIVAGQLIISFPRIDGAGRRVVDQIRHQEIEHVTYIESMDQKIEGLGLKLEQGMEFEFHLIAVPAGQENWKSHFLQFFYKHAMLQEIQSSPSKQFFEALGRSNFHFIAAPNHLMSLAGAAGATGMTMPVSVNNFRFSAQYPQFRSMIGLPVSQPATSPVRVLVLDSGIAADAITVGMKIHSQHNVVDPKNSKGATDDVGHGTAIALIISDLAPHAEFTFVKIADSKGRISEWDALAGMVAKTDADIINLSIEFGLGDQERCEVCGRSGTTAQSRSAVFENVIGQLQGLRDRPFIVAAAGNSGVAQLAYPARFGTVLAIGSLNSRRQRSSFSNYGNEDHVGQQHPNHFVLPGGERPAVADGRNGPTGPENMLISAGGIGWRGTSLSAAFASGLIAHELARIGDNSLLKAGLLSRLTAAADRSINNYSIQEHGNGLMRV